MQSLERRSAILTSRRFAALPLLAILAIAACKDDTPTSAAAGTVALDSTGMSMNHGPAATGFTVELLARSSFPDDIAATFRINSLGQNGNSNRQNGKWEKYRGTQVVHVEELSDVVVAKVTVDPGGSLGWHTHPGPAIASVASGELTIINAKDCKTRRYAATQAFVDPGQGNIHIAFNASAVPTVVYVTFLDVPAGQPPTIAAHVTPC